MQWRATSSLDQAVTGITPDLSPSGDGHRSSDRLSLWRFSFSEAEPRALYELVNAAIALMDGDAGSLMRDGLTDGCRAACFR
jgi:hypothetical protein